MLLKHWNLLPVYHQNWWMKPINIQIKISFLCQSDISVFIIVTVKQEKHKETVILIQNDTLWKLIFARSAGAVEYTDCISAEGIRLIPPYKCPWYDTKQSDGEVPVILELWEMQSTPSLLLLPGPLSGPE